MKHGVYSTQTTVLSYWSLQVTCSSPTTVLSYRLFARRSQRLAVKIGAINALSVGNKSASVAGWIA